MWLGPAPFRGEVYDARGLSDARQSKRSLFEDGSICHLRARSRRHRIPSPVDTTIALV